MNASETVSSRLRNARELLGQTQAQFAARLGVSVRAYSRYENDGPGLPEDALKALAALGISLTWLISGTGEIFIEAGRNRQTPKPAQFRDDTASGTFDHLRKPSQAEERPGGANMSSAELQAATRAFMQIVGELDWQPPQLTGMAIRDAILMDGLSPDMAKLILSAVRHDLGETKK